jgi:hypothetical protein
MVCEQSTVQFFAAPIVLCASIVIGTHHSLLKWPYAQYDIVDSLLLLYR